MTQKKSSQEHQTGKGLSKPITKESDRELFNPVEGTIGGKLTYIKNPLDRLDKVFNFYREQYMVLGSNTSVGKTALLDHFILSIIRDYPKDMHFEVLYYSMERKKKFKYAKWVSWNMKDVSDMRISSDTILNRNGKLTDKQLVHIKTAHGDWLDNVLQYVDIREGRKTVKQIEYDIERVAKRLGTHFSADDAHIYQNGKIIGALNTNQYINTKYGKRLFTRFDFKGKTYTLYQNDNMYVTPKPTIVFIIIDHIGKIPIEGSKKATLDRLDEVLSSARDKYSFSPIAVSQFNRGIGSTDRQKLHKGDLSPTLEDFKDTGNLIESADLVLSLFDPARYKSWNAAGEYDGYQIRDNTITPLGQQRARALFVLKNSFGMSDTRTMLRFTGESAYFESMPSYNDTAKLTQMYNEIAKGK